jgi:hypothetical protein
MNGAPTTATEEDMKATSDLASGVSASPAVAAEKPEILWASDPIRPGETVLIQGHAFTEEAVVEASPAPGQPMRKLEVLDRSQQCLKALIPPDWTANMFELQVSTRPGKAAALLNRPASVFWVGDLGKRQTPGGRFRLCGRNMLGDPKAVRVRLTGPRNVDVPVEKAEDFALTAVLPANVPPDEYALQVHNGWGKEAGWSDPIAFVVDRAKPWPETVFNVKDFGARGNGMVDDTAAVQAALAKAAANGGGIVFFPRGRYEIRDTLKMPRFTVLRGEKREWVELMWADLPTPVVLVQGANSFGIEEITLSSRNYADGIVSDSGLVPDAGAAFAPARCATRARLPRSVSSVIWRPTREGIRAALRFCWAGAMWRSPTATSSAADACSNWALSPEAVLPATRSTTGARVGTASPDRTG